MPADELVKPLWSLHLYVITTRSGRLFGLQTCTEDAVLSAISASWIISTAVTCRVLSLTDSRHCALIRHKNLVVITNTQGLRSYVMRPDTHSASLTHHQIRYEQAISKWTYGSCYHEAIFASSTCHFMNAFSTSPGHRQKEPPGFRGPPF